MYTSTTSTVRKMGISCTFYALCPIMISSTSQSFIETMTLIFVTIILLLFFILAFHIYVSLNSILFSFDYFEHYMKGIILNVFFCDFFLLFSIVDEIHSCWCLWMKFIYFRWCIIFHSIDINHWTVDKCLCCFWCFDIFFKFLFIDFRER